MGISNAGVALHSRWLLKIMSGFLGTQQSSPAASCGPGAYFEHGHVQGTAKRPDILIWTPGIHVLNDVSLVYLCGILTALASQLHGAKIRLHSRQNCHSCRQHAMHQADLIMQRMPLQPISFQVLHAVLELPPRQRIGLDGLAILKHLQGDDAQHMCIFTACELETD